MQNKRVFVFIYEHLKLGGIEKNLVDMLKAYHKMNIRIVWLRYGNDSDIYEPWKEVLINCCVEIVKTDIKYPKWFEYGEIHFSDDEDIFAMAFEPLDFVRLVDFSKQVGRAMHLFYMVPHFEQSEYYLEDSFWQKRNKRKYNCELSRILDVWNKNGNILYFGRRHQDELHKRYGIEIFDREQTLYQKPTPKPVFDETLAIQRAKRTPFRIVSCGRFDFPHKAYVFGLVKTFAKMKNEFPKMELEIVGYGNGEAELKDYISSFPSTITNSIHFHGAVSPDDMVQVYRECSLNVSVAGAVSAGAATGLVSLAARHYSKECEVYGWFAPGNSSVLHDEPGEPLEKYLRVLLSSNDDEYIQICRKSFSVVEAYKTNPEWLFSRQTKDSVLLTDKDREMFLDIYKYRSIKKLIKDTIIHGALKIGLMQIYRRLKVKFKNFKIEN